MDEPTTKAALMERLRRERTAWEALLERVPPDKLDVPFGENGWTVKDVVAHVAFYEWGLVHWLEQAMGGAVPDGPHDVASDMNERNEQMYAANRGRPVAQVMTETRLVNRRLIELLDGLDEAEILDPHPAGRLLPAWWEDEPYPQTVAAQTWEHYHQHRPALEAWLAAMAGPT